MQEKRKKILIVDDEPFNLLALKNVFNIVGLHKIKGVCFEA